MSTVQPKSSEYNANQPASAVKVQIDASSGIVKKDNQIAASSTISLAMTTHLRGKKSSDIPAADFAAAEQNGALPHVEVNPKTKALVVTISPECAEAVLAHASEATRDKFLAAVTKYGKLSDDSDKQGFEIDPTKVQAFLADVLGLGEDIFKELEAREKRVQSSWQFPPQQKPQTPAKTVSMMASTILAKAVASTVTASASPVKKATVDPTPAPVAVVVKTTAKQIMSTTVAPSALKAIPALPDAVMNGCKAIDSSKAVALNGVNLQSGTKKADPKKVDPRTIFLNTPTWKGATPVLSKSSFVPNPMVTHLMTEKKNLACSVKYEQGDKISNMEAAIHTFVTPVVACTITGDYVYKNGHTVAPIGANLGRQVILSTAIHPDFEDQNVMMQVVEITDQGCQGKADLPVKFSDPKTINRDDVATRNEYDTALRQQMVYHLTENHQLPKATDKEVRDNTLTFDAAILALETAISDPKQDPLQAVKGKYVKLTTGHVISLELLFNSYRQQLRNEFSVLEATLPQGYVYTIDPPRIFAQALGNGGPELLNRLQALAFREIAPSCKKLGVIGYNDFADKKMVALMKKTAPNVDVQPKSKLFDATTGLYKGPEKLALVLHNNSDGFGQNIEHEEGAGSMDAAIGRNSDASKSLDRKKADLCSVIV